MGDVHPAHRLLQVRVLWCLLYCTCPGTVLVLGCTVESPRPSSIAKHPGGRIRTKQNRGMERNNEWKHFASSPPLCTSHLCKYRTVSSHLFSPSPRLHRSIAPVYPARDQAHQN
jgi:hypothetical protein